MADKPLTACPKDVCPKKKWGKGKVKKKISAGAGLIFKGSGFYITDYRSESYKDAAKKDASASSSSSSSTSSDSKTAKPAASESKPAAKTEAKPAKPSKSKD
jgi:predicted nucleic acid-binding Zn ribbon protein